MEIEQIKTVAVIGGGSMGQGIAQNFAEAGLSVLVLRREKKKLDLCLDQIDANLKLFQEFGLLKESIASIESRIQPVLTENLADAIKNCDFVVETVSEDLELKRQLFAQLDSSREDIILSSNTSSIPVSDIAKGFRTGHRFIGLHYFNPPHIVPAVEIHYSHDTSEKVISVTKALMLKVGKKPIVVKKEIPGFVVNRLQSALTREIDYLLNESIVSPEDIDMATKAIFGLRWSCIGIIEAMDMHGLDVIVAAAKRINKDLSNSTGPSAILSEKVNRGELGIKSGRGWFDYTGKSMTEILDNQNRRLLKQLALFRSLNL